MYPAKFDYYRANSLDEALSLLQQHGENAKVLAGGHSLIPSMKLRLSQPPVLIDIGRVEDLRGIRSTGENSAWIGAMTTYAEIAADETLRNNPGFGALVDACSLIGDVQVRNCGTIGGNLSHNDPASDLPGVALALDSVLEIVGPAGENTMPASDFIVGLMETALGPADIVRAVNFQGLHGASAYEKFENSASGYAICGIAAYVDDGQVRVAVNGALDRARRLTPVEEALGNARDSQAIEAAAERATEGLQEWDFMSDIHADADYRAHLMKVLTRRALEKAITRARNR
ncbi:MAG: xanthine dehydrogenase family protein subunit M [Chloroflexota bacterium]|nr:xanthine dehydrogenase family protein subunit M [Chloroflexota bacterium]